MRCATGWGEGAFSMSKSSGVIAPASEAEAFFKANPNVDSIEMIYTDMGGVPRGKRLRQHEVIAVYENGRMFPGSITVVRSEEHTSELQSLMRISYAGFCLKKKTTTRTQEQQQ